MKKFSFRFSEWLKFPRWFTWHRTPYAKDNVIKSLAETVLYVLFFMLCFYFYITWSRVKVHRETVEVECLDLPESDSSKVAIAAISNITYQIPMTKTELNGNKKLNGVREGLFVDFEPLYHYLDSDSVWSYNYESVVNTVYNYNSKFRSLYVWRRIHVELFWIFISICNTDRNKYTPKLKGTKKCNCRFVDFGANASSFSIITTIQDLTIR